MSVIARGVYSCDDTEEGMHGLTSRPSSRFKLISSELYQYLLPQAATEEFIAQRPESEGKPADSADSLRFARNNLLK